MPTDLQTQSATPVAQGPADARWQLARTALAAGKSTEATQHLLEALEFHPASPALLLDLVRAAAPDADPLALWAERFVRAAADPQGRFKLEPASRKLLPAGKVLDAELAEAQKLATLRAAAVAELTRLAERHKPVPKQNNAHRSVLVRWFAELLLATADRAPLLLGSVAQNVDKIAGGFAADHDLVVQGLLRILRQHGKAPSASPTTGPRAEVTADQALRAARLLLGLQRQAGFKDLQGSAPPNLTDAAAEAQRLLAELAAVEPPARVWTIQELERMSPVEAEAFTQAHRRWHSPGVASSTTGKYRIETICGHATLLAAARTVELHHDRLAGHYGQDPFTNRPGIVRLVPEHGDLETEGAPYWWAGGFQAGDRTTLRFAWGDIPGLGRGLTHELTHRFDGVLRPFLGSWFTEGHASWTAGHYAKMADTTFVERHLDLDSVLQTSNKGYGGREKFEQLLRSAVEEYRDNYFAGYSLYAFLRSYPPGKPRYHDNLAHYEKNARAGQKDPVGWFTTCFADGKEGRPATFDELLADWQGFLRGVAEWVDDKRQGNEWVGRYPGLGQTDAGTLVLDEPTWSWARNRAEPFFGQDHAAAATLLLQEVGDLDATIAAGLWSLTVDGWRLPTTLAVHKALLVRSPDAAMAFAAVGRTRFPDLPAPAPSPLLGQLRSVRAYVDALAARAGNLAAAGRTVAAAALAAEHAQLARRLGLPPGWELAEHAPPAVPVHLGGHGFTESGLTGFEDRRVRGLWYATPEGDLHVGRERPREATGAVDRAAHQRDAFVHTVAWQQPGAYVLRGRVHFTTSYVSGAIVFGHTRRDRDLRLTFSAGDFRYAIGKENRNRSTGKVHVRLHGLWERDGRLPGTTPGLEVEVPAEQGWFDYTITIRGPRVQVDIGGEAMQAYAVHDGAPIEGHVGFAMGMGAVRVQQPTVQRLDDATTNAANGLDPNSQPNVPLDDLLQLPTSGLPRQPGGTLVLWLPKVADGSPIETLPRALPVLAKLLKAVHEYPQPWVLAVPRELPAADRDAAQERLREFREAPLPVVEHVVGAPFAGDAPWVLFVDDLGILRAAAEVGDPKVLTHVQEWSRRFRSR
jgi:hypothetical protein